MSGTHVKRPWVHFGLICLLGMAIVVACGGDATPQYGHQVMLSGTALLACSQECTDRGQCGFVVGTETQAVLIGSPEVPSTKPRQFALPTGSQVVITGEPQSITLILTSNANTTEAAFFYPVTVPERNNATGWVAGWCLTSP